MSDLTTSDFRTLEQLIECFRGRGYVLDFSDRTFAEFFEDELNVDIDNSYFHEEGTSKGKRLRFFLKQADNGLASRAIHLLQRYRTEYLDESSLEDPVKHSDQKFSRLLDKLSSGASPSVIAHDLPLAGFDFKAEMKRLYSLRELQPVPRGFAFERFLHNAFERSGFQAGSSFRNTGEQIDGSFKLEGETYLLEAKWTERLTNASELHSFNGKLEKAAWTRGVFISYNGFSEEGLIAFGRAGRLVCVEGRDIYESFKDHIPLGRLISGKVRKAAESGKPFVPYRELSLS